MNYDKKISGFISSIVKLRGEFTELLVLAVALAFGINLASTYFDSILSPVHAGAAGIAILIIGIIYVLYLRFFTKPQVLESKAVISTVSKKNQLVRVEDYRFSESFNDVLESLFNENNTFRVRWKEGALSPYSGGAIQSKEEFQQSEIQILVREITEYIYFEYLSIHLVDYFNNNVYNKRYVQELSRKELPAIILSNSVLDIISKDRKDRPAFTEQQKRKKSKDPEGEVVYSRQNGVMYSRFSLVLPKGSRVIRETDSSITIKNRSIDLNFQIISEGLNALVHPMFEKYYMNIAEDKLMVGTSHYAVRVVTKVTIRPTFALFSRKVKYHQWAESFLESIEHKLDFETFLEDINWRTIKTMLKTGGYLEKNSSSVGHSKKTSR